MPATNAKQPAANTKQLRRSSRVTKGPASGYSDGEDEDDYEEEEEPTRTRSTRAKKAVNGSKGMPLNHT